MPSDRAPAPGPQLTSAAAAWVVHLLAEVRALSDGAAATAEAECHAAPRQLYLEALDEVSQALPELRPTVLETRTARHDLFEAARDGGDRSGPGQRLLAAVEAIAVQLPVLERGAAPPAPEAHRPDGLAGPGAAWWPELLSAGDIADRLKLSRDAVDACLRRYRRAYPDCATETEEGRRRNEPRYLYRVADVLPHLRAHFRLPSADETRPSWRSADGN
jgi:hypothetical protein